MSEDRYAWPEWMPAPQQDSFSIQPEDRRLMSETEAGSIIRYQFDTDVNVADCTLILNRIQAAWFEAFERDAMRQGTVWFDFPLWIGGEIVHETCRFKTRPKAGNLIGLHTTYTFSLYVSKRSDLMPECVTEFLYCYAPKDICFMRRSLSNALTDLARLMSLWHTPTFSLGESAETWAIVKKSISTPKLVFIELKIPSMLSSLKKYMLAYVATSSNFSSGEKIIKQHIKASASFLGGIIVQAFQTTTTIEYINERIGLTLSSLIPTYGIYAAMEELQ